MLKLLVIGNLGKDAIVNTLQSGQSVINFSVAHTEKYKDNKGEQHQKTTWVDCAWWTDKHAVVPYLKKGTSVYVEGVPEVKTFSKNDGTTGTSLTLRLFACQLLGGGNKDSNGNGQAQSTPNDQQQHGQYSQERVDDLPF